MNKIQLWITRPSDDAKKIVQLIQSPQINSWIMPTLKIVPFPITTEMQEHLYNTEIIIATSRHAIIGASAQSLNLLNDPQWFAVGQATANELVSLGIKAITPSQQDTEGLLDLPELADVKSKKIVILKGVGGRPLLTQTLTSLGAQVIEISLYQRQCTCPTEEKIDNFLQAQGKHIIMLASGETLECLLTCLTEIQKIEIIKHTQLIVMSQRIAHLAIHTGWKSEQISVAANASLEGLLECLT